MTRAVTIQYNGASNLSLDDTTPS